MHDKKGSNRVAILIPAYNEENSIGEIIENSKRYGEVIVLDDGSSDHTRKISKENGAIVFSHKRNYGVGIARRTLYALVNKNWSHVRKYCIEEDVDHFSEIPEFDAIVNIDADGELNPDDIPKIVKPIIEGNKDLVVGVRDFSRYPLYKRIGNIFLTLLLNILFNSNVKDSQCGLKAMTPSLAGKLKLSSPDYAIEADIILEAIETGANIGEACIDVEGYRGASFLGNFSCNEERGTRIWTGLRIFSFIVGKRMELLSK